MELILIIYIVSIIGTILAVRYDQAIFDENSWTVFLVFCPAVNSGVCAFELLWFISVLFKGSNKKLYKLITYKKNNK